VKRLISDHAPISDGIKMSDEASGIRVFAIGDAGSGKTGLVKLNVGPAMQRCVWSP
jgi:hypothetical protein